MKLGLTLNSLKLDVKEAISCASKAGLSTVDIDATRGEITPKLSYTGRRDLLHYISSLGMEISALGGDFGRAFSDAEVIEVLFEKTQELIGLAIDLKVKVITTRIGQVPEEEKDRAWATLQDVLNEIGSRAERYEIFLASHMGDSTPAGLKKFLDSLKTQGIKSCYDPSVLVPRDIDPVKGVHELGNYIVHAYARDIFGGERGYAETVPGKGIVPLKDYVLSLCEVGYDGRLVIRREAGEGRIEDIVRAKEFLERIIS